MSDLTELFSRDPLKLSKDDVKAIVLAYREKRRQFNLGGTLAGKAKVIPAKSQALMSAIKSDDLDI
jgi:hypothetical protein